MERVCGRRPYSASDPRHAVGPQRVAIERGERSGAARPACQGADKSRGGANCTDLLEGGGALGNVVAMRSASPTGAQTLALLHGLRTRPGRRTKAARTPAEIASTLAPVRAGRYQPPIRCSRSWRHSDTTLPHRPCCAAASRTERRRLAKRTREISRPGVDSVGFRPIRALREVDIETAAHQTGGARGPGREGSPDGWAPTAFGKGSVGGPGPPPTFSPL